jgi:methyl-accepting chemotaxis protein
MRVEGESIPVDTDEGNENDLEVDTTAAAAVPERPATSPSATADRFARIIEDAQSSTQEFLETVRRQSQTILEEAEDEARRQRAAMLEETQTRVDTLVATADEMLGQAERLRSSLEDVSMSLRESASRLRSHVDDLVDGGEMQPADDDGYDGGDADHLGEDAGSEYPPPNRRRFGLR